MCAAPAPALEKAERRASLRCAINVPLDVIALRAGVPEDLPGRCTDLSEGGIGAMVAGDLSLGQQVAIELRLPHVGVPLRARALVRYQGRLHYGFEFVVLPVDQREMIRYWARRLAPRPPEMGAAKAEPVEKPTPVLAESRPKIRIRRRWFNLVLAFMLLLAAAGWWQWQRSWEKLEGEAPTAMDAPLRVSPLTMEMRIVSKTEPVYPEEARHAGKQGLVVLDALIAPDGTVERLQPLSGDDLLVKAAEAAVRSWKFEPYQSSGRAVEIETTIAIEFRLN
jgi:TonB family protein